MKKQPLRFLVLTTLIFSLLPSFTPVHASSLTVTSLADNRTVDGSCTLREAIQNANNNAATNIDCAAGNGADIITFNLSGTITLLSSLPTIADAAGLALDGTGQTVTISGNNLVRVASVDHDASLTMNNLTIANGSNNASSSSFENYGTLTITNCVFNGNNNSEYDGGAIYNQSGSVTVTGSTFSGNTATNGNYGGGGIYSLAGSVTIINSIFSGNTAANGGGIYCYDCTLHVTGSTFSGNMTPNGSGGGINNYSGNVTITDSVFSGNGASWGDGGGAIYSDYGALTITNSSFSGNSATGSPGGAIFSGSSMNIKMSTFSANSAGTGGGIFSDGDNSTIANSSFSGNSASANGGGVLNTGTLIITNSTFSGNSVPDSGGGIGNSGGTLTLRNTIVASSASGGNCSGTITNGGNNLDDGSTCGWGSASGSMSNTNPLLGELSGSPAYFPLNDGSPAIDKGNDAICAGWPVNNQSQNSVTRPQGAHCEMGSFEYIDTTPPVVQSITRADPNPICRPSVHFTVTFSEDVSSVDTSDFALTVSGLTGAAISGVSGGAGAYTVTVNSGCGSGTIRLDLVDDDTIVDLSLNPLGGVGAGNGNYDSGETYDVICYPTYLPLVLR
jgi:CSLREA domain-containing protein